MSDNNRDELILQYLEGALAPDQHAVLEARLLTDPEWKEAFDRLSVTSAAIRYYGIRQEVAAVQEYYFTQAARKQRRSGLLRTLRIATAVAATILFFFIAYKGYEFYTLSGDKVYSQMYVPYSVPLTRNAPDSAVSEIESTFAQKEYKKVDSLLKATRDTTHRHLFLAGLASLELKDYPAAVNRLQRAAKDGGTHSQDAAYYLTLAYVQNRDYDLAIELMEQINDDPMHPYHHHLSGNNIRDIQMLKWK